MFQNELEQFTNLGLQLSHVVETRLEVQNARWVHAQDLAVIGLAVYGGEKQDIKLLVPNIREHVANTITNYRADTLQRFGLTRRKLEKLYPDLIGNDDYSKGAVANGLRKADKILNQQEFRQFQMGMAWLMARYVKLRPNVIGDPNVRLDPALNAVKFVRGLRHYLSSWPTTVIEYGPGAVGFKKIPVEVMQTPQTIFIESNYYINQFLFSGAVLYGMREPQVITRMDGIQSATDELLRDNPEGVIDLVIMSMVHSAGEEETQSGVDNAYKLLRRGGLFVVQAAKQVQVGEASADFIKEVISDTFLSAPPTYRELTYFDLVHRISRDVFQAVYVR